MLDNNEEYALGMTYPEYHLWYENRQIAEQRLIKMLRPHARKKGYGIKKGYSPDSISNPNLKEGVNPANINPPAYALVDLKTGEYVEGFVEHQRCADGHECFIYDMEATDIAAFLEIDTDIL
ncbi:MAG: hypothetical protein IJT32_00730 [Lachnospiraceae bacterium]|nr:hypothetical protein [Lachnospiraceae bacterium]